MEHDHTMPPPVAFYFQIEFLGPLDIEDMAFLEVSGMSMELETQEIDMGGGHKRVVPVRLKHGNLVLKRPLHAVALSDLSDWTDTTMRGGVDQKIVTCDLMVKLLNGDKEPQCGWYIKGAYPVKWDIAGFDSKKNDVALETIEFAYDTASRVL